MVAFKLASSTLSARRVRSTLTILAIALSVSLVVAVTSGYSTVQNVAQSFLTSFLGDTDAQITRANDRRGGLSTSLVDALRADPGVKSAVARFELESVVLDAGGQLVHAPAAQVIGVDLPRDTTISKLNVTRGQWFTGDAGDVAVIDQAAVVLLKADVGQTFILPGVREKRVLRVVGVVHKPSPMAAQQQTIYVPLRTMQSFASPDAPDRVTRVMVTFKPATDSLAWGEKWKEKLKGIDPAARLKLTADNRREMNNNLQGMEVMSYMGGTISMLTAAFIVFSALSMGVTERQRVLAMLRAIGATRVQVGKSVVIEGMLLAAVGVAAGVPLGVLWLRLLQWRFSEFITPELLVLNYAGMTYATLASVGAAIVASVVPAWQATRVSPLEAMAPLARPDRARGVVVALIIGLALAMLDTLFIFGPVGRVVEILGYEPTAELVRSVQFYGHFLAGLPGIMLGFFLLAPAVVWVTERVIGPVVAPMLGVRFSMLRQQLTGGVWRAAGTCAALMVGLATLVAMQTQGTTLLKSWRLPDRFPDIFMFAPTGVRLADLEKVRDLPQVLNREVTPITVAAPEFGTELWRIAGASVLPNATMFLGIEPGLGLEMMQLEFRENDGSVPSRGRQAELLSAARERLARPRGLVITDEFRQIKSLKVGDTFPLKTIRHGVQDYTIAGIVWSPGMDVIVSRFDMGRQFDQRTAATVFGTLDDAKEDFGVDSIYLLAANLKIGAQKEAVVESVRQNLGGMGMRVGDVREIKHKMQEGFGRLLLVVSTVALAAMAVSSLGVTNTIMASVRSRRWQFGILRSIGVTRWQLVRLVFAEAVLIGLVGVALGLGSGLTIALNAKHLTTLVIGYNPPLLIPWPMIGVGCAAVMLVSVLASVLPALGLARSEPLALLQSGRSGA